MRNVFDASVNAPNVLQAFGTARQTMNALRPQEEPQRAPAYNALAAFGGPTREAGAADTGTAILSGLVARGIPEHIARGFAANAYAESGWDTGINEVAPLVPGSRGGFGLMQWTGPRRVALEQFAAQRGTDVSDLDTQLDFLAYEIEGPESRAYSGISGTQTPEDAARAVSKLYLRPGIERMDARLSALSRLPSAF